MTPFGYLKRHFSNFWLIFAYFRAASLFASISRRRAPVHSKWRERAPLAKNKSFCRFNPILEHIWTENDIIDHLRTYVAIWVNIWPKIKDFQKFHLVSKYRHINFWKYFFKNRRNFWKILKIFENNFSILREEFIPVILIPSAPS